MGRTENWPYRNEKKVFIRMVRAKCDFKVDWRTIRTLFQTHQIITQKVWVADRNIVKYKNKFGRKKTSTYLKYKIIFRE